MSAKGEEWDYSNAFQFLFYAPPKKEKCVKKKERLPKMNPKDSDKVVPPTRAKDDDILEELKVTGFDLCIEENTEGNHTEMFACADVEENGDDAELVVRRGQDFKLAVTFNMEYNLENHELTFLFKTGTIAERSDKTHGRFQLDETGTMEHPPEKWSGRLVKRDKFSIIAVVHIPHTCAIGDWTFTVYTKTKGRRIVGVYECPEDFIILFNPWCKDDQVYIGDLECGTDEYILNDQGAVFRGNAKNPIAKVWNFGQFDAPVLEAALFIIMKCFNSKTQYMMSDAVAVVRAISQAVNCCDEDNGLLWGNWSGEYADGKSPNYWISSVDIINLYMESGPVKYGQCWVFSALTTTICRALGIPARSVTNYGSAHDTDNTCTIDKFYTECNGQLEEDKIATSDSVWNYHLWNEVWMKRPDITAIMGNNTHDFDGWQAIDATPQEASEARRTNVQESLYVVTQSLALTHQMMLTNAHHFCVPSGLYRCGPASIHAIKTGKIRLPYDTEFIFSEVNADIIYWKQDLDLDSCEKFNMKTRSVGKSISTKLADGKAYSRRTRGHRSDLTDDYKYKEGTADNRKVVMRAAANATKVRDAYKDEEEKHDVKFKLKHENNIELGKDIDVKLTAINTSENKRTITSVTFGFIPRANNGNAIGGNMKKVEIREETELEPNKEYEFNTTLTEAEYFDKIDSGRCMSIEVSAVVARWRSRPKEVCVKNHGIELDTPSLDVEMPETVKKGESFEAVVSFTNPLNKELTGCTVDYESRAFKHLHDEPLPNVPANGKFEKKFVLTTKKKGKFTVTVKFNSDQLNCITGSEESIAKV